MANDFERKAFRAAFPEGWSVLARCRDELYEAFFGLRVKNPVIRKLQILFLGLSFCGCSAEQVQGPFLVGAVMVSPLLLPFVAVDSSPCRNLDQAEPPHAADEIVVAPYCSTYARSPYVIGWIDARTLLIRGDTLMVYTDRRLRAVTEVFPTIEIGDEEPCTDRRGNVYDVAPYERAFAIRRHNLSAGSVEVVESGFPRTLSLESYCRRATEAGFTSPNGCREAFHTRQGKIGTWGYGTLLVREMCEASHPVTD